MLPEKCFRDDLSNCLIDFKKKVTITALLNDYGGSLEQISSDLKDFVAKEEKSKKFDKNYLVRGFTDDKGNQLITIVNESKLEKLQNLLRKPVTLLFSIEEVKDGDSQLVNDHTFQPIKNKWIVLNNVRREEVAVTNSIAVVKEEPKPASKQKEEKKDFFGASTKKDIGATKKESAPSKKEKDKPKPKESPKEEKKKDFFGAPAKKDSAPSKKDLGAPSKKEKEKPKESPAKKQEAKANIKNMFQKQAAKTPVKKIKEEPETHHSPNIFEESSDEEETIAAMKKDLDDSDEEMQEPSTSSKRRRIVDSEDEEEMPEKKVEKLETNVVEDGVYYVYEDVTKEFEDEDGFIVKKTERVRKAVAAPEKVAEEKKPAKKTPVKADKKKTPPKAAEKKKAAANDKRKQGSITSFFTKK